jgi:hypothetical protein
MEHDGDDADPFGEFASVDSNNTANAMLGSVPVGGLATADQDPGGGNDDMFGDFAAADNAEAAPLETTPKGEDSFRGFEAPPATTFEGDNRFGSFAVPPVETTVETVAPFRAPDFGGAEEDFGGDSRVRVESTIDDGEVRPPAHTQTAHITFANRAQRLQITRHHAGSMLTTALHRRVLYHTRGICMSK